SGRLEARIVSTASRLNLETFTLEIPGGSIQGSGSIGFQDGRVDVPLQADLKDVGAFASGLGLPLLGGKAALQGRVTGSREAPRFQGRLNWQNPRVALQTIDQIEADLDLTPRLLRTSRLILRVGSTTATLRGSVAARGSAPLRTLHLKQDLLLDLQGQINPGRTADIARFLPDNLGVRAAFRASGRIAGTPGAPTGEADVTLTSPETWGERWQQSTVKVQLLPDGIELGPLLLQRGTERVTGALHIGKGGDLKGRLVGAGLDLSGLNFLADSRVAGRADIQADLQGSAGDLRMAGNATSAALLFRGIPLGSAAGAFTIAKQGTELDLTIQNGAQRVRLNLGPPPDRSLRLDLDLANADLDPILRIADVESLRSWQARGTGRLLLRGAASDLAAATGEATLSALRLRKGEQVWNSRSPVELSWRGQTVTLRQMQLRSGEKEVDLRGTLGSDAENDLQVKGSIPLLILQERLPIVQPLAGEATADLRIRGPLSAPDMQGTLGIAGGRLALRGIPVPIEDLRGNVEFQGQRLSLRAFQGRFGGGNLRGSGEVSRDGEQWSFRTAFQEDDGRAEQLLAGLYKEKSEVTGALSLGGSLASRGRGEEGVWSNLEGSLKLVMRDGQMGRQAVTTRILSAINIGQLFDTKNQDVSPQGLPYQRLTADIAIEQGVARTENLLFESRAFNLSAVGEVNLAEETIKMDLAVRPFQNVDRFLSMI
ncbi:MAG TPA: AsmA-like C-terminal region-containing protein, partial [Candidatus Methylomirabilis sp.]